LTVVPCLSTPLRITLKLGRANLTSLAGWGSQSCADSSVLGQSLSRGAHNAATLRAPASETPRSMVRRFMISMNRAKIHYPLPSFFLTIVNIYLCSSYWIGRYKRDSSSFVIVLKYSFSRCIEKTEY